jgi:hypothetical protein
MARGVEQSDPRCIAFGGEAVDEAIAREILRVVQPGAIEAAILASEGTARKYDEMLEALKRDLEAARYAARRAQKQYDTADPGNRLVADELERRWNQALQRVREVELRIAEQNPTQERAQEFIRASSFSRQPQIWNRCGSTPMPTRD